MNDQREHPSSSPPFNVVSGSRKLNLCNRHGRGWSVEVNWPSMYRDMFRRGPCKLFGQQRLDEVSLRLGIAPLPIKLHVIGIDRWLCELLPNPTSRS